MLTCILSKDFGNPIVAVAALNFRLMASPA